MEEKEGEDAKGERTDKVGLVLSGSHVQTAGGNDQAQKQRDTRVCCTLQVCTFSSSNPAAFTDCI